MAREKNLVEHYNTAWALFDKTTTMMKLQHRDIALLTTGAAELEHFPDLKSYKLNLINSKANPFVEILIGVIILPQVLQMLRN